MMMNMNEFRVKLVVNYIHVKIHVSPNEFLYLVIVMLFK